MDLLEGLFVFCFVFGLATSVISFAVGSLHGDAGHDAGGHDLAGAHGAGGGDAHAGDAGQGHDASDHVSPLNLQTATAFLAFFGGIGYLLHESVGAGPALALIGATVGGLVGGAVIFLFLARVLVAGQRFVSPEGSRLDGTVAQVSVAIRPGGTGEIIFSRDGARRSEGARSATGDAIPVGTEVVVVRYERGIAFVEPWASFVGEA
ncbi:MAG: NfeD family protein [Chloroflexota bacterium]|nr:NfeD family protein [Chloroflexota bacterium]